MVVGGFLILAGPLACSTSRQVGDVEGSPPPSLAHDAAGFTAGFERLFGRSPANLNGWAPPPDEAACAARALVDRLGVERLGALGFDPNSPRLALDFTPAEVSTLSEALSGCIDFTRALTQLLGSYDKIDPDSADCFASELSDASQMPQVAGALLSGKPLDLTSSSGSLGAAFSDAAAQCLDPDKDLVPIIPSRPLPDGTSDETASSLRPGTSEGD